MGQTKLWKLAKPEEVNDIMRQMNPKYNEMSGGEKTGVAFGVLALVVLVVLEAVLIV